MSRPGGKSGDLLLRLYVAGSAPNSLAAIANATTICEAHFASKYSLEIVDMLKEPGRAIEDGIIVTPTLLKLAPPPLHRMIGSLVDTDSVVHALKAL